MNVRLPEVCGCQVRFESHGIEFYVKKHKAGVYSLNRVDEIGHNRWGNAEEIRDDIDHVLNCGRLPCCKQSHA